MIKTVSREELFEYVRQIDFALYDITLYLDTHPCDQNALAYYKEYKKLYAQAVEAYTMYYGPLNADNVLVESEWTWTKAPWPWEGEEK